MGATQDPSGLYRFEAVWDHFLKENININIIYLHVLSLQKTFPTFNSETSEAAERLEKALSFGFGLYQDLSDVAELAARLKKLA